LIRRCWTCSAPAAPQGAGSTTLWVNYLLKEGDPTHRPISFYLPRGIDLSLDHPSKKTCPVSSPGVPSRCFRSCRGSLFPLSEKGSPPPAGILSFALAAILPHWPRRVRSRHVSRPSPSVPSQRPNRIFYHREHQVEPGDFCLSLDFPTNRGRSEKSVISSLRRPGDEQEVSDVHGRV
jgi:hypothetical protein